MCNGYHIILQRILYYVFNLQELFIKVYYFISHVTLKQSIQKFMLTNVTYQFTLVEKYFSFDGE